MSIKTDTEPYQGIVYVATGDARWARMCLASIASLRAQGYTDHFFIITDQTDAPWPDDKTIIYPVSKCTAHFSSRYWKTQVGLLSPFTKSIFLDCDILAISDLKNLWCEVNAAGIGLTLDIYPTLHQALIEEYQNGLNDTNREAISIREHRYTAEMAMDDRSYYNAGIICWSKNAESDHFFTHWHNEWKRFSQRDQFALARALPLSGVTTYQLSDAYNFNMRWSITLAKAVNRHMNFVHFWGVDNKRAFWSFQKQIRAFDTLDTAVQQKLKTVFREKILRERDIVKLLPLIFIFPPATGWRLLKFIGLSIVTILYSRRLPKFLRERSPA